jgi:hypothetical protein
MSISLRFYLFTAEGMQRISQRVMDGLCHGEDAMPQFAETKQRVANVVVELEDGKPSRILETTGSFLHFDKHGKVHESLAQSGFEAIETYKALERSKRIAPSKIVHLAPKLNREKWQRENRWQPSSKELDEISADIWRKKEADSVRVAQAKGAKPIPPKMTFEATEAIREIQSHLSSVDFKLEALSEAALKGVAFEARSLAAKDLDNAIWLGVAKAADRRREILARHRNGKGIWYASIEIIYWDTLGRSGRGESIVHEKCNSKKEAEEAARRLLAENAKYFSSSTSIEADVVCDLEWDGAIEVGDE